MANNIISYELLAAAAAAENGVRRTWSPEQYREYAAKLDRLVEAAKRLKVQAKMTDDYCDSIGGTLRNAVTETSAALRDIELESEVNQ